MNSPELDFKGIRNWVYRNARPLDLARWQYHFEQGTKESVLTALSAYQNGDGGFGHALEADIWNPESTPIQTWTATEILCEIAFTDKTHPIVKDIIKYLDSGADFDGKFWFNTVLSNNDHPHAPWWHTTSESTCHTDYNPTAALAGFGLAYAEKGSSLYQKCAVIAVQAVSKCLDAEFLNEAHTVACFVRLLEYAAHADFVNLFDVEALEKRLAEQVTASITKDTSSWATSYVCKPSQFITSPDSPFYEANKDISEYECDFIIKTVNLDGVWDINWQWNDYPNEWAISKNWWKATIVIKNMLFLKAFHRL